MHTSRSLRVIIRYVRHELAAMTVCYGMDGVHDTISLHLILDIKLQWQHRPRRQRMKIRRRINDEKLISRFISTRWTFTSWM